MFLVIFLVDTLECFWSKKKGDGVGVLGVMFRMKGVFTTRNALSRLFYSVRGRAKQALGRNSLKNTEKLRATPNQRIKKARKWICRRENAFHSEPNP